MERLLAALLGCLLTGGVIFGARPVMPRNRLMRPVVYSSGPGGGMGRSPAELARWFQPVEAGAAVASLPPAAAITHPRAEAQSLLRQRPRSRRWCVDRRRRRV